MDPTIVAAIIAAVVAIVAPILTLFIKRWLDEQPMRGISDDRVNAVGGDWSGKYSFSLPPATDPYTNELTCTLAVTRRKLTGTAYWHMDSERVKTTITGWPLNDSFFMCEYRDENRQVIRHGTAILRLSPKADELVGRFLGYSPERDGLIEGEIAVSKNS